MILTPLSLINDSIEDISKYIVSVSNFIKRLLNEEHVIPPFQCDLSISLKVWYLGKFSFFIVYI